MKCAESKELLSDYADGLLDGEKLAALEAHLQACRDCALELGSLQSLLEGLKDLEPVKAPADFLQLLHRRMERPRRWQRVRALLFRPARIKIPLQLAGALVTAFLVFSIVLHQQEPALRKSAAPGVDQPSEMADLREKEEPAPAVSTQAESKDGFFYAARGGGAGRETAPTEWVLRLPEGAASLGKTGDKRSAPPPAAPRRQAAAEELRAVRAPGAVGRLEPEGARDVAPALPAGANEPLSALEQVVLLHGGRVVGVQREGRDEVPAQVEVEIPLASAEAFRRSLEALGALQVPEREADADDAGTLRLRIRIE